MKYKIPEELRHGEEGTELMIKISSEQIFDVYNDLK